jgi:hypothetical protein
MAAATATSRERPFAQRTARWPRKLIDVSQ